MSIALVASAIAEGQQSSSNHNAVTAAQDTTGANLILLAVAYHTSCTVTDNKGNTWTPLTAAATSGYGQQFYYCSNPTVGSGHTFTVSNGASDNKCSIAMLAFSGVSTTSPLDQQNGHAATATGHGAGSPGSITPSVNNALVITATNAATSDYSIPTVASGFTTQASIGGNGGDGGFATAIAYKIQTTASAENPAWSCSAPSDYGVAFELIASFKPQAAASFTASPATIPAGHSGNITLTLAGANTSWTSGTTFSIAGVSGAAKVSQSVNAGAQTATLVITTGAGTGTLTISDSTDSATATVTVATATLALSPTSNTASTSLTLTGTNTLWSTDIAAGNYTASNLFSVSGSGSPSISAVTSVTATGATTTITFTGSPTLTITDNSTGATATFTGVPAAFTALPAAIPANHSGSITLTLVGAGTLWTSGSTVSITNSITGTTTVTKGTWSCASNTWATLTVTTGAGAGTYKLTIDGVDCSTTLTVGTPALAITPATGSVGTVYSLTVTGTNTLWAAETAAGLFTVSGGTGTSIATPSGITNTGGTVKLTVGSATGTLTITDTSTGATASFTATSATSLTSGAASYSSASTTTITLAGTAATGGSGGTTYQWQRSADASTWANVTGATNYASLVDTPPAQTLPYAYRLAATAGGTTVYSNTVWAALANQPLRIGWIGDSIWAAIEPTGSPIATETVPVMAQQDLAAICSPRTVTIVNTAVSGSNTAGWQPGGNNYNVAIAAFAAAGGVDYVMLMLGANDAHQSVSAATYGANLSAIVNALVAAGMRVILNYPGNTWPGYGQYLASYWPVISGLVNGSTILLGDTQFPAFAANNPTQFNGNVVHPNLYGQYSLGQLHAQAVSRAIGDVVLPAANKVLYPTTFGAGNATQGTLVLPCNGSSPYTPDATRVLTGSYFGVIGSLTQGSATAGSGALTAQQVRNAMALPLSEGVTPSPGSIDVQSSSANLYDSFGNILYLQTSSINANPHWLSADGQASVMFAPLTNAWTYINNTESILATGTGPVGTFIYADGTVTTTSAAAALVAGGGGGGGGEVNIVTENIVIRSDS